MKTVVVALVLTLAACVQPPPAEVDGTSPPVAAVGVWTGTCRWHGGSGETEDVGIEVFLDADGRYRGVYESYTWRSTSRLESFHIDRGRGTIRFDIFGATYSGSIALPPAGRKTMSLDWGDRATLRLSKD